MIFKDKIKIISPMREILELSGSVYYGEGQRAWNVIRFKKELLSEFPQLKNRRDKFGYKLFLYRNYEELRDMINKMQSESLPVPLFLFFFQKG